MVPSVEEILATVRAIAEAFKAYFTWLMTDEGKVFSQQVMKDRAAWDKFWSDAADSIGKFFNGDFFKVKKPS